MSSADFLQISNLAGVDRPDRLLRAAFSAFCSLTRPTRRDISQIEDLAIPLFDAAGVEARRYAAAALSENPHAPRPLVLRIAAEPGEVSAPLLIRSPVLADVDLLALIGRHGLGHARVIGRRAPLNPSIAALIRALTASTGLPPAKRQERSSLPATAASGASQAERVRADLRGLMRPAAARVPASSAPPHRDAAASVRPFHALKATALSGHDAFFRTALADALGVDYPTATEIAQAADGRLESALVSLGLSEEQAFLVFAAARPGSLSDLPSIRETLGRLGAALKGKEPDGEESGRRSA